MPHPFLEEIRRRVLVCDGGMGTLLYERGVNFESSFDGVCLTHPDLVREIHRDYIKAGADVIETNSFGANYYRLEPHGLTDKIHLINRTAASLARQAREEMGKDIFVAGAIGPTGKRLFPLGPLRPKDIRETYLHQTEALLEGGVDLFILETFSDLEEIELAIAAIREHTQLPLVAEMTFNVEMTTLYGATPEDCARFLSALPVDLLGANCSVGPQMLIAVIDRISSVTNLPLSAMPNASLPKYVEGRYIYHTSPDYFAEAASELLDKGVRLLGGCCGTTPLHIEKVSQLVIKKKGLTEARSDHFQICDEIQLRAVERRLAVEQSGFARALEQKFVISVELDPPRGSNPEKILKAAEMLSHLGVDAVNIADSPMARVRMGALAAAGLIVQRTGLEAILHITGRDRNLMGLQADLLGAHALGIRNILAITGDPPMSGSYPNVTAVYDVDSLGLLKIIDSLNQGNDMAGNSIGTPTSLTPGVGVNPVALDYHRELERFRVKIDMGAVFAMTQPLYDIADLERFLNDIQNIKSKILVGILPLLNFRHANFLHNEVPGIVIPEKVLSAMFNAGDSGEKAGVELTLRLLEQVQTLASGVYFMPSFGRFNVIADIIRQSHLAPVS